MGNDSVDGSWKGSCNEVVALNRTVQGRMTNHVTGEPVVTLLGVFRPSRRFSWSE